MQILFILTQRNSLLLARNSPVIRTLEMSEFVLAIKYYKSGLYVEWAALMSASGNRIKGVYRLCSNLKPFRAISLNTPNR